jgi:hypothetical protein
MRAVVISFTFRIRQSAFRNWKGQLLYGCHQISISKFKDEQPVEKLSSFKATSIGKLYSSNNLRDPGKGF